MSKKQSTDRDWILDPNKWPNWPACPMVNRKAGGAPNTALIMGDPTKMGDKWHVWFVPGGNIWRMDPEQIKKGSYEPLDAILADGWEVD